MKLKKFVLLLTMIGTLSTMSNVNAGALSEFIFQFTINVIGNKLADGFKKGSSIIGAGVCVGIKTSEIAGQYNLAIIINYVSPVSGVLTTERHNIKYNKPIGLYSTFVIHGTISNNFVGTKIPIQWKSITNIVVDPGEKGVADFDPESIQNLLNITGNNTIH